MKITGLSELKYSLYKLSEVLPNISELIWSNISNEEVILKKENFDCLRSVVDLLDHLNKEEKFSSYANINIDIWKVIRFNFMCI